MSGIVLIVELTLEAGARARYLDRARAHRARVLAAEPGCRRFDVAVPDEDADTVYLYEVYADEAALEAHTNTPYMKEYLDDTGPLIVRRRRTRCRLFNA